jgi:hypothetical protein
VPAACRAKVDFPLPFGPPTMTRQRVGFGDKG